MFRKHLLIGAAACAALACAGLTRADVVSTSDVTVKPVYPLHMDDTTMPATAPTAEATTTASGPPPLPLNGLLGGIPHYADLGLTTTGYVEGSWTYAARPPVNNALTDRVFDVRTESIQLDAADLSIARSVDYTKKTVDVGFALEGMYGQDGSFIHSNGLTFYGGTGGAGGLNTASSTNFAATGPRNQADLVQANFTVMLPFGHGIGIEGGKFLTLPGYEVINATQNQFYSHSYIFDEEPFTNTGLLGIYNLVDPSDTTQSLVVTGGFSRGWDQATEDNNGSLDILAQVKYTLVNKFAVALSVITGDETPRSGSDGWRTLVDLNGTYNLTDQITLGFNGMYTAQAQDAIEGGVGGLPGTAQWYGFAGYAKWALNDYVALNLRGEWFDDQDGGAVVQLANGGATGISDQFYEVTFGVTYKPLADDPNFNGLAIRPEVRWDYANHRAFGIDGLGNPGHHDQLTAAVEAYFAF